MQALIKCAEAGSSRHSYRWRNSLAALGILVSGYLLAAPQDASAVPPEWGVVKTAAVTQVTLAPGQTYYIDFTVTVTRTVNWTPESCVVVSDSMYGALGTVCASDGTTKSFSYSIAVSYPACGDFQVVNTARIIQDKGAYETTSSWTVDVNVPCGGSCTLTQGYWKTHSLYGPAPYDDTWAQLPAGADTSFFLSGRSYYQVLWTPPRGNVYYQLAHQFIAATLNGLNGADLSSIGTAMAFANNFFSEYTPASALGNPARSQARAHAATLDHYNNGLAGPGHCSEDTD